MNFFEAQEKARHNTAVLSLLFAAAVAGLIALLYVAVHVFTLPEPLSRQTLDYDLLLNVALGVGALISIGTLYKTLVLAAGGGAAVAESMGGRLIPSATNNPDERRLLNIVSEMALASGCPVPRVYVLPDDNINAFAAGTKIGNAVIGVTHGAMKAFSRDEMQGVIAHEFSHIMNGDMRLNLKLIGIIHGIMLLSYLGYFLLRSSIYSSFSSSRNGAAAALPIAGLVLLVAGSVGAFFGGWIRAAVSRQREYLADASAVQYTRNPQGIGGALQKIGVKHGLLKHPHAAECAHMFFANGVALGFSNMFASHPPIEKRIKCVLPEWDGKIHGDAVATPAAAATAGSAAAEVAHLSGAAAAPQPPDLLAALFGGAESAVTAVSRAGTAADFATAGKVLQSLPQILREALEDSYSARALVYAMLLDDNDDACRRAQCGHLRAFADTGVYELSMKIAPEISRLPCCVRLPLLMQTLPALRMLSSAQYALFTRNLAALIAADEKVSLFEWGVEAVLLHYLEACFGEPVKTKIPDAKTAARYALSVLAQAGEQDAGVPNNRRPAFDPHRLEQAMRRLDKLPPAQKRAFIQAAADLAARDGILGADEGVLLRVFAALLDCPLPPALVG